MSDTQTTDFQVKDFLAPKYWFTWLGIGLLWLTSRLPLSLALALGTTFGWLAYWLMPSRRRVARINLRRCFPDLPESEIRRLLKHTFFNAAIAMFESALAWWGPDQRINHLLKIEGKQHIDAALAEGKGVLLLGGHYTCVEMGGRIMSAFTDYSVPTYKRAHNALFEAVMTQARHKLHPLVLRSLNMRGVLKLLKANKAVWYAPDQDFGMKSSVFAPFLGVQTATLTLTARLAKVSGTKVLPWYVERLPGTQGYKVTIGAPLEDFPSNDDVADATKVNRAIEEQVRRVPEQYLWGHRRFKTRPRGEPLFYKPRRDSSLRKYSMLLGLLSVPAIFYTIWQAWRYKDWRYLTERLGLAQYTPGPIDIWLHASSVGEVNAMLPLVELIARRYPHLSIIFTVNTPTGSITARNKLPAHVVVHYMPIDWQFALERFTTRVKPRALLITETEVWPNLYLHCHYKGIHLTIINGRLANRILSASPWIKRVYGQALQRVYWVLARSEQDRDNFQAMGANPQYIKVIGNIKFATPSQPLVEPFITDRPYVLAASTRNDEERLIAECWKKLTPEKRFLIIVPRHPKRLLQILRDLKPLGLNIAVRSRNEPITEQTQIYLADTFGELNQFITGSQFVIMGGSLKPFGGQNILEVARAGKAVIFGPHMDNFSNEAELFVQHDVGIQVKTDAELCATVARLLSEPERADHLGKNGLALMKEAGDMAERYLAELESILPLFQPASSDK